MVITMSMKRDLSAARSCLAPCPYFTVTWQSNHQNLTLSFGGHLNYLLFPYSVAAVFFAGAACALVSFFVSCIFFSFFPELFFDSSLLLLEMGMYCTPSNDRQNGEEKRDALAWRGKKISEHPVKNNLSEHRVQMRVTTKGNNRGS